MAAWAVPNGINLGELTSQMGAAQPTSSAVTSRAGRTPARSIASGRIPVVLKSAQPRRRGTRSGRGGLAEQGADDVLDVA